MDSRVFVCVECITVICALRCIDTAPILSYSILLYHYYYFCMCVFFPLFIYILFIFILPLLSINIHTQGTNITKRENCLHINQKQIPKYRIRKKTRDRKGDH
ncbi:hypothetical protein, unlikely [Trypanosoma brucei gambiense DAL972]|uniref:Uncharacterized protein n=2 Tax=Trypanosoma brucei TaxID=5691 RepID=Q4GYE9_TRYB2|nr:hypothetical protein, unlikely [Trypanosoma brucei brucei TREU927]XP_011771561.1 hypothetical protein, unlikely [Trypanosoma brucei gambiense DAL972]CAJ16635.1 hypothetical protein, unlikely [Trypanosoma brucei brucei TREU927]CBH09120.1 hypothetical protein, unlikely [Trypanosoma brucei gambiense DAL972]|eukprot:XP_011771561.1 hypothetical protein, unlikely [Trypanosoma brucei gambiense DAL972]